MKKILSIILLLLMPSIAVMAQEKQWNILKHDKNYIWGEGTGTTEAEADKNALADLISRITVSVTQNTDMSQAQKNVNGTLDEVSQFKQTVNTYASQTLTNTVQYNISKGKEIRIGRAIKVEEVENMFKARANRAADLVASAEKAVKKGRIDDAMRNYYWALTLLKSLQYPNKVMYTEPNGTQHVMTNWIKEQLEDLFDETKITCVSRDGDDVDVDITYKGKPVNSAAFTYFDGYQWSSIVTASDGYAKLEFAPKYSASMYKVRLEFQFKNEAKSDKEVESVLKAATGSEFRRAEKEIKGIKPEKKKTAAVAAAPAPAVTVTQRPTFTSTNARLIKAPEEISDKVEYQTIATTIENAIRAKQTSGLQQYFTTDGWDIYNRLIGYGSAKVVGIPSYKFYENGDFVTARGLQMSFSFKNGTKKSFVEEVIFTFDKNRKICNVSFGLGRTAEDDILHKGVWSENARLAIMNFLENYKTAYALKRLDYIQSIFDEDAIIIIGNLVKKASMKGDLGRNTMSNDQVKYNRYNKEQYMDNLRKCFGSQEFVNIHFSNNDVRKSSREGAGELYGIQLEQDYHSTTYGDHGYLFLLVDLNNPAQPLIKIRTWQPTRDGNGHVYGIEDF